MLRKTVQYKLTGPVAAAAISIQRGQNCCLKCIRILVIGPISRCDKAHSFDSGSDGSKRTALDFNTPTGKVEITARASIVSPSRVITVTLSAAH